MSIEERPFIPLSAVVADILPMEWIEATDGVLDVIGLLPQQSWVDWSHNQLVSVHRLVVLEELSFALPLIPGAALYLGTSDHFLELSVRVSSEPELRVEIDEIELTLHFPPNVLRSCIRGEADGACPVEAYDPVGTWCASKNGYDLTWRTGVRANLRGDIAFTQNSIQAPAFMIADTGVVVDLGGDSAAHTAPDAPLVPAQILAGEVPIELTEKIPPGWKGVWIGDAKVHYEKGDTSLALTLLDGAVGDGGFSGTMLLSGGRADRYLTEDECKRIAAAEDAAPGAAESSTSMALLQGSDAILVHAGVTFSQSVPTGGEILGYLNLPLADKWARFRAVLGGPDGDLLLELAGAEGGALIDLSNDWVEIRADSLSYVLKDGVSYAAVAGSIRPKIGGFDWPWLKVERLLVSQDGDIELEGGWIDLPEEASLDFHGFALGLRQFGAGTDESGQRRWIGFTGSISIGEELGIGGSVDGLRFSWLDGTELEDLQVTLSGIGVHLAIPEVFTLDGAVEYKKVPAPGEEATPNRPRGDLFTGRMRIKLHPLDTELDGELMIGRMTNAATGRKYTAFYLFIEADLPVPVPLGTTGTALHAVSGLFGLNVAPSRGEEQSWYSWYKEPAGHVPKDLPAESPEGEPPEEDADAGGGDDTSSTEYKLSPVGKWLPAPDSYAFGAGMVIGTQFDDGYSLHVGATVAVLIPGPVVMIEGRADLLRARGDDRKDEGAFHALAVVDGRASTFTLNVDARYHIDLVLDITGGLEAFFDFHDSNHWYIHLGEKEPESKRVQAKALSLFTTDSYFMIDPDGIQLGGRSGYDLQKKIGPVKVALVATLAFDLGIFWKPLHVTGALDLRGEIGITVYGVGLDISAHLLLEGEAPRPYTVHGLLEVALSLPWPLPDQDFDLEFTWTKQGKPKPVSPFLKAVTMVHHKAETMSWSLGASSGSVPEGEVPVVPVDSRPILSFARPLSNSFDGGDTREPSSPDVLGDTRFSYFCDAVRLFEYVEDSWEGASRLVAAYDPSGAVAADPDVFSIQLLATSLRPPGPSAQEPLWELWSHSALDCLPGAALERWISEVPACAKESMRCVVWSDLADGTALPFTFERDDVVFLPELGDSAPEIRDGALRLSTWGAPSGRQERLLTIRFQRPVRRVQIELASASLASSGRVRARAFHRESAVGTEKAITQPIEGEAIDCIEVLWTRASGESSLSIKEVCHGSTDSAGPQVSSRTPDVGPVLRPGARYRLEVQTRVVEEAGDEIETPSVLTTFFRTAVGPGTNNPPIGGPLDDLGTYVAETVPAHGIRHHYAADRLAVVFNEAYVPGMYSMPLHLRVRDRNGRILDEAQGQGAEGLLPELPVGEIVWQRARGRGGCADGVVAVSRAAGLVREAPDDLQPRRMYHLEVVAHHGGEDHVLHQTVFSTSRFSSFEAHLRSGRDVPGATGEPGANPIVHALPGGATMPIGASASHRAASDAVVAARLALRTAWSDAGTRGSPETGGDGRLRLDAEALGRVLQENANVIEAIDTLRAEDASLFAALDVEASARFGALGLSGRPLPERIELFRIASAGGSVLLIESPEPLDAYGIEWTATLLADPPLRPDPTSVALRLAWSEDATRVFVFKADGTPLAKGHHVLLARRGPQFTPERQPVVDARSVTLTIYI